MLSVDLDHVNTQAEIVAALPSKQHSLDRTLSYNLKESEAAIRRRKSRRSAANRTPWTLPHDRDVEQVGMQDVNDGISVIETEEEVHRKMESIKQMTSSLEMKRKARFVLFYWLFFSAALYVHAVKQCAAI